MKQMSFPPHTSSPTFAGTSGGVGVGVLIVGTGSSVLQTMHRTLKVGILSDGILMLSFGCGGGHGSCQFLRYVVRGKVLRDARSVMPS